MRKDTPKVAEENATPETRLRDVVAQTDPDYEDIPHITIAQLRQRMQDGEEYYDICPVDSVIRETHFLAIANAHNIDYDEPYENRLNH